MSGNELDLANRLAFARIDVGTREVMRDLWLVLEPELPAMLVKFYAHLKTVPHLADLVARREAKLVESQTRHWKRLFTGDLGEAYAQSIVGIGRAHHRIGLEPRWYIAAYQMMLNEITAMLIRRNRFSPGRLQSELAALNKALMLDLDFALSAYQGELLADNERIVRDTRAVVSGFETRARDVIATVDQNAIGMKATGGTLAKTTKDALAHSETATKATQSTATGVQAAAAAAEELSASIAEISQQVAGTLGVVEEAARATETSAAVGARLATATTKIGEIIGLIKTVADQTNLLALNATIEAARAGEAGRGFGVVAEEVKALAAQTKRATEEIARQIAEIQKVSQQSSEATDAMTHIMSQIGERTGSIAAAIEQQSAATQEIAQNMTLAANATTAAGEAANGVAKLVATTGEAAGDVLTTAESFAAEAGRMTAEIEVFLKALWEGVLDRREFEDSNYPGPQRRAA
jgi:methyl-accepting chemotaxis protein